jgi:MFS family permease
VLTSAHARRAPYAWFVASVAAWALAAGMQQVLFSWLVIGELHQGPQWMGAAQMCQMLPSLLFLLVGGVTADRGDCRRLLLGLHTAAALAAGAMAVTVQSGAVGLAVLIAYGLSWGTIQTFAQPARDALLSDVAGDDLMRAVTGVTLAQFAGQALGSRLAGLGASLGNATALAIQASLVLIGALPLWRLPHPVSHPPRGAGGTTLAAIRDGLREVWESDRLRPVALLVAADGLFYMGPYLVLCPLAVRDVYRGDVRTLSLAMMSLTLGTIAGSLAVLLRGGVRRKGRAFLLALLGVACCLLGLSLRPPFWGFVSLIFLWGICHSFFFNTSRTLFQHAAPPSHRARVLSVHGLGLLGMAPVSNLGAGFLAMRVDPLSGCALAGGVMVLVTSLAWAFTSVRHLE